MHYIRVFIDPDSLRECCRTWYSSHLVCKLHLTVEKYMLYLYIYYLRNCILD